MIYYLIASILIAVAALFARTKRAVLAAGILFYAVQIAAAGLLLWGGLYDTTSAAFFTFDALGTLFYLLLVVVSMYVFGHSEAYLQGEDLRSYRLYFALLMLLTTAIAGAYFANNLAVTWIFLEATTLCSAEPMSSWAATTLPAESRTFSKTTSSSPSARPSVSNSKVTSTVPEGASGSKGVRAVTSLPSLSTNGSPVPLSMSVPTAM